MVSTNIVDSKFSFINPSTSILSIGVIITIMGIIINEIFVVNFSFEAILLIYINRISKPPTNIKNMIIGTHAVVRVCANKIVEIAVKINNMIPMDIGVFNVKE